MDTFLLVNEVVTLAYASNCSLDVVEKYMHLDQDEPFSGEER
jgi:hypothetical protein